MIIWKKTVSFIAGQIVMTDVRLSNRMKTIVNMVDEETVADIGCDHAFVSIALIQSGKALRVIAMDVNPGPIHIAGANVSAYHMEDKIQIRLSDGFAALREHEVECAIIAGMGGQLMVDILRAGNRHLKNGIHLVLQPQSEMHVVRAYLHSAGYEIICEDMMQEDGKYYVIMKAVPSGDKVPEYSEAELMYGRILLESRNSVLMAYLKNRYKQNRKLYENLTKADTQKARERAVELQREQVLIRECLRI